MSKSIVILYHADCRDGFGAAWAAWKRFGARADYRALEHHLPPPFGLREKELYFLDFCYPLPVMRRFLRQNRRVVVIDHHVSKREVVKSLPEHTFDLRHSGAVLAWQYFFPKKPVPRLLRHVEDWDLWRFRLPRTRELSMALALVPFEFRRWDRVAREWNDPKKRHEVIRIGAIILQYRAGLIGQAVGSAEEVRFEGYRARAANSAFFRSEIGHALSKSGNRVGIVWYQKGSRCLVSLRSSEKGPDVSVLATRYGGGGHRHAAGFDLPTGTEFPWKPLKTQ